MMKRLIRTAMIVAVLSTPALARADAVLDWNAITIATLIAQGQNPFAQARFTAISQLAVFEAVNAVTRDYQPYVGIVAPAGASPDAAAVAAAYAVLTFYFPSSTITLDVLRANSLAAIPDGTAKNYGIAVGQAAAAAVIALRAHDGSAPLTFYLPGPPEAGVWQTTSGCTAGGILYNWPHITPFGVPAVEEFRPDPPPALTSRRYSKDFNELRTNGAVDSSARPADRSVVARLYAASSPTFVFNLAARQVALEQQRSLSENARAFALLSIATTDSLVASMSAKYYYTFWRPETAIHAGDADDNPATTGDLSYAPFITTPCFPSYPSNHASGSNGAAEILRRVFGEGGHAITIANPAIPGVAIHYRTFNEICADIDDARVYGGIHFRFDQEAGGAMGREIGTYVYKHNLQRAGDHR